ncbi:MAG: hypothetical protein ACK42A_06190 [Pyrinomonadaceae bacterium]|jgi:hypothetical protein
MLLSKFKIGFALIFGLIFTLSGFAQTRTFSDPEVEFTFEIPDDRWKIVGKSPYVNLVFNTAREGELEIRKITAPASKPISEVIRDEEQKLQFMPGYVAGKEENFSGILRGAIFNFEFVRAGRNMSGRFYFLRADDTVYVLRFTGYSDSLRSLRVQTDIIARTFQLKK